MPPVVGRELAIAVGVVLLSATGTLLATQSLTSALLFAAGLFFLVLVATRAAVVAAPTLALGILFTRPFFLGQAYTSIGLVLIAFAALLGIVSQRGVRAAEMVPATARSMLLWISAFWAWMICLPIWQSTAPIGQLSKGALSVVGTVLFAIVALSNRDRRLIFGKLLTAACILISGSYALTLVMWLALGFDAGQIGSVNLKGYPGLREVFFPFTITSGRTTAGDISVYRLLGFAREPGLMQMMFIWAFFTLPALGWTERRHRWMKPLLVLGLIGTQSTAGLGIFATLIVINKMFLDLDSSKAPELRRLLGCVALAGSLYVALYAPVFGLAAKQETTLVSVTDRTDSTEAGLRNAWMDPLGKDVWGREELGGSVAVNLLAGITLTGVPGFILVSMAFLRPAILHRRRLAFEASIGVYVTALVSQPIADAPAAFVIVLVACMLAEDHHERLEGLPAQPMPPASSGTRTLGANASG